MDLSLPLGIHLSETKHPDFYVAYSVPHGLSLVAVTLRLLYRTVLSRAGLWLDDYLICIASVNSYPWPGTVFKHYFPSLEARFQHDCEPD